MILRTLTRRVLPAGLAFLFWAAGAPAAQDAAPAEKLIEAEHWSRAKAFLDPLLFAHPDNPRVLFLSARCREAAGDYSGARDLAEKSVSLDPKNADYRCLLAYIDGREGIRAGLIRKIILARRVKREAEAALALDPRHEEAHQILIEFYRQAPGIVGGDKARSRRLAEKTAAAALRVDPGRVSAYGLLAQVYARGERWPELESLLQNAEKNVPDNRAPYLSAGRVLLRQGRDFARAERFFRRYLEQPPEIGAPSQAQAYWRLGLALEKLNRKPEAVDAIAAALKLDPKLDAAKKDLKRLR